MAKNSRSLKVAMVFMIASLLLLAPTYLASESSADKALSLSISDVEVESEQEFTVDIKITSNPGIWALGFLLTIPDGVSVSDVTFGKILSVEWSKPSEKTIHIYGENSALKDETATGLYAKLSMKADKTSTDLKGTIVASKFDCIDVEPVTVSVNASGGSIIVTAPEQPHTHNWADTGKGTAATCETAGEKILVCTECSKEKHETIPAKGHSWSAWKTVKEPTATEEGLEERTCSVCKKVEQRTISKTECVHDWVETGVTEPTCEKAGERVWKCSKCHEEKHETIPAIGHDWSEWKIVKEPTDKEDGVSKRTCKICGETEQRTIPKIASDNTMIYIVVGIAAVLCVIVAAVILMRKRGQV